MGNGIPSEKFDNKKADYQLIRSLTLDNPLNQKKHMLLTHAFLYFLFSFSKNGQTGSAREDKYKISF